LESTGLHVTIAKSDGKANTTGLRLMTLELVGSDQVGIVSKLTAALSERNISIEHIDTSIVQAAQGVVSKAFKIKADLLIPKTVNDPDLRQALDALASEMTVDIALGG
jgi:methionyl-tRNA formyltransferase